jgi:hypothetical protein
MISRAQNVDEALSQLLAEENARVCGSCGSRSSIPASIPQVGVSGSIGSAARAIWFCFECGHEEEAQAS